MYNNMHVNVLEKIIKFTPSQFWQNLANDYESLT